MWILFAGAAQAGSPIDREQPGGANLAVAIELTCGSLVVRGSDRPTVRVGGSVEDPDALSVRSSPGLVAIEVGSGSRGRNCGDLVVDVPICTAIDAELVSAPVTVEGVTGPVDLETVSGRIRVEGSPSRLDISSISGEILFRGAVRRVQAETVSGGIALSGVGGSLELSTVSGQIRIEATSPLEAVAAESVSGGITVAGALAPSGRLDLESHSGTLTVGLPADTNALISWSTFSGQISNGFGGAADGRQIRLGTGDGRVSLETFSGGMTIARRE